ncbi:hypothetical protein WJX72_004275 [[Myrmecia] bisecta]|uniref:Uncharacterized protein n=1 Tax=[Myrmecia] bisecta TaxID=41462 RepID=A0AAW1R6R8_9CHLO
MLHSGKAPLTLLQRSIKWPAGLRARLRLTDAVNDTSLQVVTVVNGVIGRGGLDKLWVRKEDIVKVTHNDKRSSYVPRAELTKDIKTVAQLGTYLKDAIASPVLLRRPGLLACMDPIGHVPAAAMAVM